MRQKILQIALAEHAAGVKEIPNGDNKGDGVTKYLPGGRGAAWCCYLWSWVNKQAFDKYSLGARHGRVSTAFARGAETQDGASQRRLHPHPRRRLRDGEIQARVRGVPIHRESATSDTCSGLRSPLAKQSLSTQWKAIPATGSSSANASSSDASIVGFINNYGKDEQPSGWEKGLVKGGSPPVVALLADPVA